MELNLRATKELFNMSGPVAPARASIGMRSNIFMRPGGQHHDCWTVRQTAEQTRQQLEQRISEREHQKREARTDRVADVMSGEVKLVGPNDSARQGAQIVREADTDILPVAG